MKEKKNFNRLVIFAIAATMCMTVLAFLPTASADDPPLGLLPIPRNRNIGMSGPSLGLLSLQSQSNKLAADWVMGNQDPTGWFPWTSGGGVYYNIQGPPGRGMLKAYEISNDVAYLNSAISNGDYIIYTMLVPDTGLSIYSDGDPRFATHDPIFLEELSQVTGDSSYADFVQDHFWNNLTIGNYGETNDMDASDFGNYVVDARNGQGIVALSPWDISAVAIAAYVAGETSIANDIMGSILYGLEQTTVTDTLYDSIGLAGAVWASAITGVDLDPTVGTYAGCDSTADLAATLSAMRTDASPKGWLWSSVADQFDYTNGDTQTTTFAIMALDAFDRTTYDSHVTEGVAFMRDLQQASGEYLAWPTASPGSGGNVEVNGEVISGIVTVSPSEVYVDDDWAGNSPGDSVGGHVYSYDAFSTIMDGIDAVCDGGTVYVADGSYDTFTIEGRNDLTVKAGSNPVIQGKQTVTTHFKGNMDNVVFVKDSTNIVLDSLDIQGLNMLDCATWDVTVIYENSTGEINNCDISPNTVSMINPDWRSIGIGMWDYSDVGINDCTIKNYGRIGVYMKNGTTGGIYDSTVEGPAYTGAGDVPVCYGIEIENSNNPYAYPSTGSGPCNFEIIGNRIYNHYNDDPASKWGSSGVYVDGWSVYGDLLMSTIAIEENDIHDNYNGIYVVHNSLSYAHYNNLCNNYNTGVTSAANMSGHYEVFDAKNNWWGDCSGPSGEGPGVGDAVSTNVDFDPWTGKVIAEANGPYSTEDLNPIQFNSSGSHGYCSPVSYLWDFGDGETSTLENPIHSYTCVGEYTVTLTVTESSTNQCFDVDIATVVINSTLVANAHGPYEGILGAPIGFQGSATGGVPPYSWYWDFGDCVYSPRQNPHHIYECGVGEYTVTLTVTDSACGVDTDVSNVVINSPEAVVADAGGPYSGGVDQLISFNGNAVGGVTPYTFEWDLDNDGDYDDATGQSASKSWSTTGTYTIGVKVTDNIGTTDTDTAQVSIASHAPDKPSKPSGPTSGKAGTEYTYTSSTTDTDGDQVYYMWDWGDETSEWYGPYDSGDIVTSSHTWTEKGDYQIKVKAKDEYDVQSPWSDPLAISMPKNKAINPFMLFLNRLIERFPILEQILQPIYDKLVIL